MAGYCYMYAVVPCLSTFEIICDQQSRYLHNVAAFYGLLNSNAQAVVRSSVVWKIGNLRTPPVYVC
jgi:hypothetical protein